MTEKEKDGVRWRVNNEELSEFLARRTFRGSPSLSPALLLHAGARRNRIPIIVPLSAVTLPIQQRREGYSSRFDNDDKYGRTSK